MRGDLGTEQGLWCSKQSYLFEHEWLECLFWRENARVRIWDSFPRPTSLGLPLKIALMISIFVY